MRTVASAMAAVPLLDASTTVQDAAGAMLDARVESAVVIDGTNVRGLLTANDVADALAEGRDVASTPVMAAANAEPTLVKDREPLAEAHERMHIRGDPLAVVVGDDGRPLGVLADHGGDV
jgi:CBS domain-containing protein